MCENPTQDEKSSENPERDVLYLLTDGKEPIWSVDDLGRAIEDPIGAIDAVSELLCAGLIHRTSDSHVFATHAGYRAVEMIGQAV
jgi:hypothetical protein